MSIQIEKNIPMPGNPGSPAASVLQTLRNMEVGDSFVYPLQKRNGFFAIAARVPGAKFKTRTVAKGEMRVWRVE
jgi:hypothetical protein